MMPTVFSSAIAPFALVVLQQGAGLSPERGADEVHRTLRFRTADRELVETLRRRDLVRATEDYGSFVWLELDAGWTADETLPPEPALEPRDEARFLLLSGYRLDGAAPGATLDALSPAERFPVARDGGLPREAGLYLVQFAGPVRGAWRAALERTGARVVQAQRHHGYLVAAEPGDVPALEALARRPEVRWVGAFEPAFKTDPGLREARATRPGEIVSLTVQLLAGPSAAASEALVRSLATRVRGASDVGPFENLYVELEAGALLLLARRPDVVALVPRAEPVPLRDERQALVVAGIHDGVRQGPPGYLAWLRERGFDASQFRDFVVHVADTTLFLRGHPDMPDERIVFEANPTDQVDDMAHGFLVASILGGFNDRVGSRWQDGKGYSFGLGVAPWVRMGSSAIFGQGPGFDPQAWELAAFRQGARISTNSWGFAISRYEAYAQLYDFLVRDADPETPGNQQLIVVAGAGNNGPARNTILVPGLSKNVLCVGASETYRPRNSQVCPWRAEDADEIDDVAFFSSRGPVSPGLGDGRRKPDVMAPGTNVQAAVPQFRYADPPCEDYFPPRQTLYSWASGTSFSTPAATGAASLLYQRFLNEGRPAPSPAMTKALLMNTTAYMDGVDGGGNLPTNDQGMGRLDLGELFDEAPRVVADQKRLLDEPGDEYRVLATVADPSRPLRVTLAWSDGPGPLTGAPQVNDLDLVVELGGDVYLGNVFLGAHSRRGGFADSRNNVESVFLPPGTTGELLVTVRAVDLPGDGVPGTGDGTDQDFALVISNAVEAGPYGCASPPRSLRLLAGEPRVGRSVVLGLGDPTGSAPAWAVPMLALSLAPDPAFPCGSAVPGGELLLEPAELLGPPLLGQRGDGFRAHAVRLAIPPEPDLIGLSLYAQGVLVADTVVLTSGHHLRVLP